MRKVALEPLFLGHLRDQIAVKGIKRVVVQAPAEQAYVCLSWKVPSLLAFDDTPETQESLALTLLSAVLDGYSGARLDRALAQGPTRLADDVGAMVAGSLEPQVAKACQTFVRTSSAAQEATILAGNAGD